MRCMQGTKSKKKKEKRSAQNYIILLCRKPKNRNRMKVDDLGDEKEKKNV